MANELGYLCLNIFPHKCPTKIITKVLLIKVLKKIKGWTKKGQTLHINRCFTAITKKIFLLLPILN
ncbi:hypothetical protein D3C87_603580 [compost metagenome]